MHDEKTLTQNLHELADIVGKATIWHWIAIGFVAYALISQGYFTNGENTCSSYYVCE